MKIETALAVLLFPVLASADPNTASDDAEYPAFRIGSTLGMPVGSTSGALALVGNSASGVSLDALLKAGIPFGDNGYGRLYIVAESTQLQIPTESVITSPTAGDTFTTPILQADTYFSAVGAKLSFGRAPVDERARELCCAARGRGTPLTDVEKGQCSAAHLDETVGACPATFAEASTVFWGGGVRVLSPRSGKTSNVGLAAELYVQARGEHVDGFLSASGLALQSWTDDVDKSDMPSVVRHASLVQGYVTLGLQGRWDSLNFGLLARGGCQEWELDASATKACSAEGGVHINWRDVAKQLNQLRFYLGFERVAGADQLVDAKLQDHPYTIVLRIEPALSTFQK